MGAVEMDSQAIERRDFPIVRRGYDPASVDAHLRALAAEVEELRQQAEGAGRDSLAAAAGAQVQGILEAAQASAQAIEAEAAEQAQRAREEATADARGTREQAVATAQERVTAVTAAAEALLGRVGEMDRETQALVESLRGGAGRLRVDLDALSGEMGALYDAAAARSGALAEAPAELVAEPAQPEVAAAPYVEADTTSQNGTAVTVPGAQDVEGARLVALNMALNGDSREDTGRYLAEHFDIAEPERLLDEVYAAIEG